MTAPSRARAEFREFESGPGVVVWITCGGDCGREFAFPVKVGAALPDNWALLKLVRTALKKLDGDQVAPMVSADGTEHGLYCEEDTPNRDGGG